MDSLEGITHGCAKSQVSFISIGQCTAFNLLIDDDLNNFLHLVLVGYDWRTGIDP